MEQAATRPMPRDTCDERHKAVDEKFERDERRLNAHGETIDSFSRFMDAQTQINQQILKQLQDMQEWKEKQDNKMPNRVEFIVRQVIQWVTLAILAIIATKIGL